MLRCIQRRVVPYVSFIRLCALLVACCACNNVQCGAPCVVYYDVCIYSVTDVQTRTGQTSVRL